MGEGDGDVGEDGGGVGEDRGLWSLAPMAWEGCSLFLSVSALSDSAPSPFLLYSEIRNSDWGESFAQIFLVKLAFLRQRRASTALWVAHESPGRAQGEGAPPCLVATSGIVLR